MPLFISYSHADAEFATKLAQQLFKHKAYVWIDQWELKVGDSLIDKIQNAVEGASALLVVLTKVSVESEWCKKELSSGLIRELEEKRVVVLPILLEDCKIPMFLRDKLYADFRTDFDHGLKKILEAVAKVTSDSMMRVDAPTFDVDWSLDYGMEDNHLSVHLTAIERAERERYSILTELHLTANEIATARYLALSEVGLGWVYRGALLDALSETMTKKDCRLLIVDEKRVTHSFVVNDEKTGARYLVGCSTRRLGEDNGKDIAVDIGGHVRRVRDGLAELRRPLTPDERRESTRI